MFKNFFNKKGVTLIETLIYLALSSVLLSVFVSFALNIKQIHVRQSIMGEVDANMRLALDTIGETIRTSVSVNIASSTFNQDPGILSLNMPQNEKNPTVFKLNQDNGYLVIQEGTSTPVELTNQKISIKNFVFEKLPGSPKHTQIKMYATFSYSNTNNTNEYFYEEDVTLTASHRQ